MSEHVVEMVKRWRGFRLWSREELANQCAQIGAPELTFAVLTNIETGRVRADGTRRRLVAIDEVYALAKALKVEPAELLPTRV